MKGDITTMKKILMAGDLSARCDNALKRAALVAAEQGAALTVVYVASDDLPAHVREQLVRASEIALRDQIERACGSGRASIQALVQSGRDWSTILEVAELGGFDLIVLGTHRMNRVGYLLGSTVERLIAHVNVPVLVVPQPPEQAYRRPIAAVDFSIHSRRAVQLARALAPEVKIIAVHAWDLPFRAFLRSEASRKDIEAAETERLQRLIDREFAELVVADPDGRERLEPAMRRGDAVAVVEAEVTARKADLLVLGTHGGGGFREAMVGSTAKTFLKLPPCDVAVVKAW
jgi:nucleotide-binding universal stress UspA family protein